MISMLVIRIKCKILGNMLLIRKNGMAFFALFLVPLQSHRAHTQSLLFCCSDTSRNLFKIRNLLFGFGKALKLVG